MDANKTLTQHYEKLVVRKFEHYNKLFLKLPFPGLIQSGTALPQFTQYALKKLKANETPQKIVDGFFKNVLKIKDPNKIRKIQILFLQFVERQIVLFDALEDSAFTKTHPMQGKGSLSHLLKRISKSNLKKELKNVEKTYRARLVLTAHPTQFYPSYVIDIIQKLSRALEKNNLKKIQETLLQLGKTSLHNSQAPTPIDEADFLIAQMRKSLYPAFKRIASPIVQLGFWPGGDRDGNPNVHASTAREVSKRLKNQILHIYQGEIEELKNYLTFPSVWEKLVIIANKLKATRQAIRSQDNLSEIPYSNSQEFHQELQNLKSLLINEHGGLFASRIEKVLFLTEQFGFHFATLDLRQDSSAHEMVIEHINRKKLPQNNKMDYIQTLLKKPNNPQIEKLKDGLAKDTLLCFQSIPEIQAENGEMGLNRYIISHTKSCAHILEIFLLAKWSGLDWKKLRLDIVPLFESIKDLKDAPEIMEALWKNSIYKNHLKNRKNQQTVMLGFSDGTKDGGYVTANWSILQCKLKLAALAERYQIDIIFFDGRGGPPSRGGGHTYLFYQALERIIDQKQIQLTIQGQTITSDFGTVDSAQFNTEQLMTSVLTFKLFPEKFVLEKKGIALLNKISEISEQAYHQLKNHPLFLDYLSEVCPLEYFGELKIASRPTRRNQSPAFSQLRAIPFVSAWSQMKQNIPGYFGLGTALNEMIKMGHLKDLQKLYQKSLYFKTLLNNAMMSLQKSNFSITRYLENDKKYGNFWKILFNEAELSKKTCLLISKQKRLLENEPINEKSISIREKLVLPLLILQQYALSELRTHAKKLSKVERNFLKKLIIRSMAANINSARNSV